jgi:spore germination cell wall hydrolase CwlJ-like protein
VRLISDDALAIVTIMQEAAGEPYEGMVGVGEVIRRRAERHFQSDGTVAGTVLRSYAFSGWNSKPDFLRIRTVQLEDVDDRVPEAARAWRESAVSSVVPDAVYYCNLGVLEEPPAWARPANFVRQVGNHSFYRS